MHIKNGTDTVSRHHTEYLWDHGVDINRPGIHRFPNSDSAVRDTAGITRDDRQYRRIENYTGREDYLDDARDGHIDRRNAKQERRRENRPTNTGIR